MISRPAFAVGELNWDIPAATSVWSRGLLMSRYRPLRRSGPERTRLRFTSFTLPRPGTGTTPSPFSSRHSTSTA